MSKDSYSHILKYTGLFGGIQFLNILISLVRNKFVAVILGPQGMGLLSLFNSTLSFMSNSTNLGISMSAVKNISEAYERGDKAAIESTISTIRSWSLVTAAAGMLLCAALSPLLNDFTFSWGDHTLHFVCLSPVVALMAVTGGETAILKGVRQLGKLARISVYNIIAALLTSVPLYYFFREAAIVPSLIIIAAVQMTLTIGVSYKLYPVRLSFRKGGLSRGTAFVKLGIAFVIAGVMGSGADFVIRSYLNNAASLGIVGLYNAGYMMTMVYSGLVFSAMETDFFPRLSAANDNVGARNATINKQIEVSLLMVSPLLVALMVGLPVVLPMLYSSKFAPVIGMMRLAIMAMYIRAACLPMAYINLAMGNSGGYMLLEGVYDILIIVLTVFGYEWLGLAGTGAAILLANIVDVSVTFFYIRRKYDYRLSKPVAKYFLIQFPIGTAALLTAVSVSNPVAYWIAGIAFTVASGAVSVRILQTKAPLWNRLAAKFKSGRRDE